MVKLAPFSKFTGPRGETGLCYHTAVWFGFRYRLVPQSGAAGAQNKPSCPFLGKARWRTAEPVGRPGHEPHFHCLRGGPGPGM